MRVHPSGPVLAALAVALLAQAAAAQVPSLSHSAPKLGNRLAITLEGATPGALVRLYSSPGETSSATPFGTLELERTGLTLIASGNADPGGEFSYQELVPLDPALAEVWNHYQALVQEPAAPKGWTLSQAVHLRYVGTRVYETCAGLTWGNRHVPPEMRVLSAIDDSTLAVIEGLAGGTPVFTDDLALGALVLGGDRLVVFDNFRLERRASVWLGPSDGHLVPGLDGRSVVVFQPAAARLLWVDLESATVTDTLTLPLWVTPGWTSSEPGHEAWIGELDPGQRRPSLRHVDLEARVVLERVPVGDPLDDVVTASAWAPGLVFATSSYPVWPYGHVTSLSTLDLTASPPSVHVVQPGLVLGLTPLVEADRLVLRSAFSLGPGEHLRISTLSPTPAFRSLEIPASWSGDLNVRALAPDGNGFWLLDDCYGYDGGPGLLLHYSFERELWSLHGVWSFGGPNAMELARDGLVDKVYVALTGEADKPIQVLPEIHVLDRASSTWSQVSGGWTPTSLTTLSVP